MSKLGALMGESHASCRDLYECSSPELEELVKVSACWGSKNAWLCLGCVCGWDATASMGPPAQSWRSWSRCVWAVCLACWIMLGLWLLIDACLPWEQQCEFPCVTALLVHQPRTPAPPLPRRTGEQGGGRHRLAADGRGVGRLHRVPGAGG